MPISGPASYIPTMDEFIAHWTSANTALGAGGPIILLGSATLATFTAQRTQLEALRAQVEVERNTREAARTSLELLKISLLERLNQFNNKLRSLSPGPVWENLLPKAYGVSDGYGKIVTPLDDLSDLWLRYNNDVGDLLLMGGYDQVAFADDLAALKTAYAALASADNGLGVIRGQRTVLEEQIYAVLNAYRLRIPAEFAEGSALYNTLPRLTPINSRTPDPVQANGTWNATTVEADLNWTASTDTELDHYEIRGVAGPEYDREDETNIIIPAAGPLVYATNYALGTPGNAASYKVYVILTTGNERGSNPVTITRPV